MTTAINHMQITGALSKATGGEIGKAFREAPSADTALPIFAAAIANLAAVGGFKPAKLVELIGGMKPSAYKPTPAKAKEAETAAPAKEAAPAKAKATTKAVVNGKGVEHNFAVDQKVSVLWKGDGKYHPATIESINGSKFTIVWTADETKSTVNLADIKPKAGKAAAPAA